MRRGRRKPPRVVLDVNVLISVLIGKRIGGLLPVIKAKGIVLLVSTPLIEEFEMVAARPKFRLHFPLTLADEIVMILRGLGELIEVEVGSKTMLSRDPKDDYLLRMARKGAADVLVTGDKDLLSMKEFGRTAIMAPAEFTEAYL
jgi:uncharacterized protein